MQMFLVPPRSAGALISDQTRAGYFNLPIKPLRGQMS
jgi:hypothetical protein